MDNSSKTRVEYVEVDRIIPNKYQPRKYMDQENLKDLKKSIEENGLIQPVLLRHKQGKYEIIVGERRFRAAKAANLKVIPAIINNLSDEDSAKLALIENIQREDLSVVEEALGFKAIIDEFNYSQESLAREIGKSRSYVANTIRLLKLDSRVLKYLQEGLISVGHGKVLLKIKDFDLQWKFAKMVVDRNLTVRETEKLLGKEDREETSLDKEDNHIKYLEDELMNFLGTRVKLVPGKEKGLIQIEYYGEEDLGRILDLLK